MTARKKEDVRRLMARNIRTVRSAKAWSQHDLAAEAGVRQALVSSLESASANPTLESMARIARALGLSVAELLSDKDA